VKLRNLQHQLDTSPLDAECNCQTCQQFSRGYLRHLFQVGEMLGPMLLSVHNLAYYQKLVRDLRSAIKSNTAREFRRDHLARMAGGP
jgi:queuine tRNA-ribosyltransferase